MNGWHARFAFASLALVATVPAMAHPGPHHEIDRATRRLEQSPNRPDLLVLRAEWKRLAGDLKGAFLDLEAARALDPTCPGLALQRGLTLAELGADSEALAELTRCVAIKGPNAIAFATRAQVHARRGELDAAIDDLTRAIELRPDPQYFLDRGELLERLSRLDEAAAGYREGIATTSASVLAERLVRLELRRRCFDSALRCIDAASRPARVRTRWLVLRAEVLTAMGHADAAHTALQSALVEAERALVRRPTAVNLRERATVYRALGRTHEATADEAAAERLIAAHRQPSSAENPGVESAHVRGEDYAHREP